MHEQNAQVAAGEQRNESRAEENPMQRRAWMITRKGKGRLCQTLMLLFIKY